MFGNITIPVGGVDPVQAAAARQTEEELRQREDHATYQARERAETAKTLTEAFQIMSGYYFAEGSADETTQKNTQAALLRAINALVSPPTLTVTPEPATVPLTPEELRGLLKRFVEAIYLETPSLRVVHGLPGEPDFGFFVRARRCEENAQMRDLLDDFVRREAPKFAAAPAPARPVDVAGAVREIRDALATARALGAADGGAHTLIGNACAYCDSGTIIDYLEYALELLGADTAEEE